MQSLSPVSIKDTVTQVSHSSVMELHFVPSAHLDRGRGSDRQVVCQVSAEPGALDWVTIDPAPVRLSPGAPRGAIPAAYVWYRGSEPAWVWCESQAEKDEVMWLDYLGDVVKVWPQPLLIAAPRAMPGFTWHVPDFLALSRDGAISLFDVRPAELIDQKAARWFEATAQICAELGWPYQVLDGTDRSRATTKNLRWLKASRHPRCRPDNHVEDQILAAARAGATRASLQEIAAPDQPARAAAWIDNLVWRQRLGCDLTHPFNSGTKLFTRPQVAA